MFANASVNFLTDQQHFSLNKNRIWGSKTRSSFNFYSKTCAVSFFYGFSGRGRGAEMKIDLNSPWFGDNSPSSVLLSRALFSHSNLFFGGVSSKRIFAQFSRGKKLTVRIY